MISLTIVWDPYRKPRNISKKVLVFRPTFFFQMTPDDAFLKREILPNIFSGSWGNSKTNVDVAFIEANILKF